MKKLVLFIPVLAVLTMTSCEKDYVCNCVTKNADNSTVTIEIDQDIPFKDKKGKSEGTCKDNEARLNTEYGDPGEVTTTCRLK